MGLLRYSDPPTCNQDPTDVVGFLGEKGVVREGQSLTCCGLKIQKHPLFHTGIICANVADLWYTLACGLKDKSLIIYEGL